MKEGILCTGFIPVFRTTKSIIAYLIICFVYFLLRGSSVAAINDNLIAYWDFNEGQGSQVFDSSGMSNTGTIYGATWNNGVSGKALKFDGINDYVEVPNKSAQQITTNQLSISLWFNLQQDIGNTQRRLICKQQDSNKAWGLEFFGNGYLGSRGNQLVFHDSNGSAYHVFYSGKLIETGVWHQVGVVDNAGLVRIYLDGQPIYASNQGYGILSNVQAPIKIGRTNPDSTFYFNGEIDEIRLYNRAISGSEMEELYLIPEPATIILVGLGFLSIKFGKKR